MLAPDFNTLYQFEEALESGFESWLNSIADLNLLGLVKNEEIDADGAQDELQKKRPRVECFVTIGAPVGPHFVFDCNGLRRENGWHATVALGIVTGADIKIHGAYRAGVRNIMSTADEILAGANQFLPYHEVAQCFSDGSSQTIEPHRGVFVTQLNYRIIFAIQVGAWPGGLQSK